MVAGDDVRAVGPRHPVIILNYVQLLPGSVSNWYVLGGLLLILIGIIAATQYH